MKKILLFLILFIPFNVYASVSINSKSAIVYDINDNKIIYEKNINEKVSVASLTKILTTITAIESIDNLDQNITITEDLLANIYWNASIAGIKVGDNLSYRDLLYGIMLPSGADASEAVARSLSGNSLNFVKKMNNLAKRIGMNNSNFQNVTGLDEENQYSTASDMLILLKYALNNKTFKEIYMTKEHYLNSGLLVQSTIKGYGKRLKIDISRILGSKTGYTEKAGLCLASLFKYDEHEIVAITLGASKLNNLPYNLIDTMNLINYVDNNYIIEEKIINQELLIINNITIPKNINYKLVIFVIIAILAFILLVVPKKSKHR